MSGLTHYEVLGILPDATVSEVKIAYHQKLLLSHPDKTGKPEVQPKVAISALKTAYRVLSDADMRREYDEEMKEKFKLQGFNITGAGLDTHTLESFTYSELPESKWTRDCPRCLSENSIELSEADLESGTPDGLGGYQIMAPCQSCSLWITVLYEEEEEEES